MPIRSIKQEAEENLSPLFIQMIEVYEMVNPRYGLTGEHNGYRFLMFKDENHIVTEEKCLQAVKGLLNIPPDAEPTKS